MMMGEGSSEARRRIVPSVPVTTAALPQIPQVVVGFGMAARQACSAIKPRGPSWPLLCTSVRFQARLILSKHDDACDVVA